MPAYLAVAGLIAVFVGSVLGRAISDLPFLRSGPVSGAAPKQSALVNPSPKAESDDQQFETVVVPATVQAFFVTDLYAKDSGCVSQVNNDIGDHVKKGQVLAVIEDPELQAQFDKAQAAVQQVMAALELGKWQLSGTEAQLNASEAEVKVKEADAEFAKTTNERWQGSPKGVVSDQEREDKKARLGVAVAELNAAQAKEVVSRANVETAKAKIASAEADLQAAKAEAERLQALLQYDKIVAPFDGVVTRRLVNPGDLVQAATSTRTAPLFSLQELDMVPGSGVMDALHGSPTSFGVAPLTSGVTTVRNPVSTRSSSGIGIDLMEGKMPAPKGNRFAKGNKSRNKYKSEYAEAARKLCAKSGFIDIQLADWFKVTEKTINNWKLAHPEFAEALRAGKQETDDLVEQATVQHICGYYVMVDEMDRFGNVKQTRKWVAGNPHAGMKWLAARRPEVYRERKELKHALSMDEAFLRFLDQMEERAKLEKARNARMLPTGTGSGTLIEDAQVVEIEPGANVD